MSTLPTHLGGLQHLAPEVIVEVGDILVRDGKPMDMITATDMATLTAGMTVHEAESISNMNIYRRIPCPRQGGERMESELGAILRDTGKIKEEIFQNLVKQTEGDIAAHNELARKQEEAVQALVNGGAGVRNALPTDAKARKKVPLASGLLDYFPDAMCAVAELSRIGNEQHNPPGSPLHWDRSKSSDEADALMRHLLERDAVDSDGVLHAVKVAWRGLALAQKKIEAMRK